MDLGCTKPATYHPATDKLEILEVGGEALAIKVRQTKDAETCAKIYLALKMEFGR